ncbi:MAG: hypothetical protein Q8R32_00385 [bacterium]|nr:hypothetical protein [bacterium]
MRKEPLMIGGVIAGSLVLIAGLAFVGARPKKPIENVNTACVQHEGVAMHIHPQLKIIIDGTERAIPSDIGVSPGCMRPIHTHDESGKIHLEFPSSQDVRLGQFFEIWKQPFSKQQILDRAIGPDDLLRVTVNGTETAELENLLLHDQDDIVLEVRKKNADGEAKKE